VLRMLEADLRNLESARKWCLSAGHYEQSAEIALIMGRFSQQRGFFEDGAARTRMGLEAVAKSSGGPSCIQAELLRELAGWHLDQFEWDEACRCATEALSLSEQLEDKKGKANALNLLGLAADPAQNAAAAREAYEKALVEFRNLRDDSGVANVLNNLGVLEHRCGNIAEASRYFQENDQLRRKLGDHRGVSENANNLGVMAQDQGDLEKALKYYQESLQIEEELGHVFGVARALSNLGEIAESQGRLPDAFRLFAAAECLFEKIKSPYGKSVSECRQRIRIQLHLAASDLPGQELRDWPLDELIRWGTGSGTESALPTP
nr:tetratricopeptide repeat protein [Armatimonadota bacterium]